MNSYLIAKHLHQATAVILIVVFVVRGVLMLAGSTAGRRRWVTLAAHVNDTVLLVAALYMAWLLGFQGWIVAKLVALAAFIVLGIVALNRGRTAGARSAAFVAALLVLAYIVSVAFTKRIVPV
jgi:uncharacterized membrane protein SirB2